MCNLLYIKEFKELVETRKQLNTDLKNLITTRQETIELLLKITTYIDNLQNNSNTTPIYTLKDWLQYKNYIRYTLQEIKSDIRYIEWKLKTNKNKLDWIPIG